MAGDEGNMKTYFGQIGITHESLGVRIEVSPQDITVTQDGEQTQLLWSNATSVKGPK